MLTVFDPKIHWKQIYMTKSAKEVSWYVPHLGKSLELINGLDLPKNTKIIDVGGGASTFPDDLLDAGFENITVLDISSEALDASKKRLGKKAISIQWIESDIRKAKLPTGKYDLWHDRAAFHFLTEQQDRIKYVDILKNVLKPEGHILLATFGPNGPLKCSGLEIVRYSAEGLKGELGKGFQLERNFLEMHNTPFRASQEFLYCLFKKTQH